MSVTKTHQDHQTRTMTIISEFDAPIARVWQMWADPRLLERWWGPPTYPATVVEHDLSVGGTVSYLMTGPEGDQPKGWWRVLAVDAPHHLEFDDGFSDDAGIPNLDMPAMNIRVALEEQVDGTTRMTIDTRFSSDEAMEQMISMGMEEGLTLAVGQIDGLLLAEVTPQ